MDSAQLSSVLVSRESIEKPEERGAMLEFEINREFVENLIRNIANEIKLERLKRPYSMLAPEPFHFPQFSKLDDVPWKAQYVEASGLEIDALYEHYGMPRGVPHIIVTLAGTGYGQEFADFTIEMFGLKGDEDEPDKINRLAERTIGNTTVSNADPDSLPLGAGMSFSVRDPETDKCIVKIHVWRWRVFMDSSSLCLENNWHTNELTGGGWIPYMLGIVYGNPEKMVADAIRFAPAFRLCNLVEAQLGDRRGGDTRHQAIKEMWSADVLKRYARLVDELAPVWTTIKGLAHHCDSADSQKEWVSSVLERRAIKNLVAEYLKLTEDVLRRAVDNTLKKIDREPRLLAYFHAALELEVNVNG